MSKIVKEVTVWNTDYSVPNHIYLLDDASNLIAYAVDGTDEIRKSSGDIKIDRRGRKFVEVKHSGLAKLIKTIIEPKKEIAAKNQAVIRKPGVRIFKVNSKGRDYFVEKDNYHLSCNCIGYGYRRKCKHVDAVKKSLDKAA